MIVYLTVLSILFLCVCYLYTFPYCFLLKYYCGAFVLSLLILYQCLWHFILRHVLLLMIGRAICIDPHLCTQQSYHEFFSPRERERELTCTNELIVCCLFVCFLITIVYLHMFVYTGTCICIIVLCIYVFFFCELQGVFLARGCISGH